MVKATLAVTGKFLACLLGILLGIILTLGALVGGGFYAYKNIKISTLLGIIPNSGDWLSDEYANNTIEGLVKEIQNLASGEITLEKVAEISPLLGDKIDSIIDNVNENGIVSLDKNALYKTPINQVTANISDLVIVSSTLNSLSESMGFALPDMPLIKGGESDELQIHTAVNKDGTLDKAIALGDYTYYTQRANYDIQATEEKLTTIYLLTGITEKDGYLTKDNGFIYVPAATADNGEPAKYNKLAADSPLIDRVENGDYYFRTAELYRKKALTEQDSESYVKLDSQRMEDKTVYQINSEYAYRMLYAYAGEEYVLATETDTDGNPVSGNGGFNIRAEYQNRHLFVKSEAYDPVSGDLNALPEGTLLYVRTNGIGDLPVLLGLNALSAVLDMNSLSLNDAGDYFGVEMQNDMLDDIMNVPLAYLSQAMDSTVENVQLADVIKLDGNSSPVLLFLAYGQKNIDYTINSQTNEIEPINAPKTIGELVNNIDKLTIGNVLNVNGASHPLLQAIENWSLKDFEDKNKLDSLTLGDIMTVITDDDVQTDQSLGEASPAILQALKDVSIGEFETKIKELTLEEMLGTVDSENTVLYALKDCTIDTLPDAIKDLAVQDLFADTVYEYYKLSADDDFDQYSELFVWQEGSYIPYDSSKHDNTEVYARYALGYDGSQYIEGYTNVPLYAYQGEGTYSLATEVTGWKLPANAPESVTFYQKEAGTYSEAIPDADNIYSVPVLYYRDGNEETVSIELIPARLGIKDEFTHRKLYSKIKYTEADANGLYAYANLYYYDMQAQTFKRIPTQADNGGYKVADEYKNFPLFTHGNPVGIWRYLLTDKDGNESIATVNHIDSLVANVAANVNSAPLKKLCADGLIKVATEGTSLEEILQTTVPVGSYKDKQLGELTVSQLLNVIVELIPKT